MYTGADTGLSVGCISADRAGGGEGETEGNGGGVCVCVCGGGALNAGLPDQRPAGERAGYRGKNNTHTIASSRHQRARSREEEVESKGESKGYVCVCACRGGQGRWELGKRKAERESPPPPRPFVQLHESMSFTGRQSITVIALRQRITLSRHSWSAAATREETVSSEPLPKKRRGRKKASLGDEAVRSEFFLPPTSPRPFLLFCCVLVCLGVKIRWLGEKMEME